MNIDTITTKSISSIKFNTLLYQVFVGLPKCHTMYRVV